MNSKTLRSKRAAMEMSVGTIVTIVLLMTVLVLGLVLVRTVFNVGQDSVKQIDASLKNEIKKLFTQDSSKKVIIFPETKLIKIKKGNQDYEGFAIAIRNLDTTTGKFSYTVAADDAQVRSSCGGTINAQDADSWIKAGGEGSLSIGPGESTSDDPIWVRFIIPETAPPCLVRYNVDIKKDGEQYGSTIGVDLKIEPA